MKTTYNVMVQKFTPSNTKSFKGFNVTIQDKIKIEAKNLKKLRKFLATL